MRNKYRTWQYSGSYLKQKISVYSTEKNSFRDQHLMQCVMFCTITFHLRGPHSSSLSITIRNEVVLLGQCLGWMWGERRCKEHPSPSLDWLCHTSHWEQTSGLLHLCEQIAMPTSGLILIVKLLAACVEIMCNSKNDMLHFLSEFYSQNSTVLWNLHLHALHGLQKVRMLTPALQIDKLCPTFITGGLLWSQVVSQQWDFQQNPVLLSPSLSGEDLPTPFTLGNWGKMSQ